MNYLSHLLTSLGAGEISGIIVGVIGALAAGIVAIVKAIGDFYAAKNCQTCPITKRDLRPTIKKQQARKAAKKARQSNKSKTKHDF